MTSHDTWILTYTGRLFWPLTPRIEDICIEDIAHALSLTCRFNGHVREFYSVAQHCVLTSQLVEPEHALAALLHDASEAYLCDIVQPIKQHADMASYRRAEERLERLICEKFHVDIYASSVCGADERLLITERRDLMAPGHWKVDASRCLNGRITPWSADYAEMEFLQCFESCRIKN